MVHSASRAAALPLSTRPTSPGPTSTEVRQWARDAGHQVSDRGAIPKAVRQKFDDAHL
ncbi:Lsr2 family DNA-binding protein [Rhodococcus sp. NBC_00297]|uniref:Lsr2 family DNA-binding protein n=1 Tax=Rhodococcus sp. NBC_00297 TaxID=2976005 RepID=UPI003FA6E4B4